MLERENINNFIADDLALRNRNWGQIEDELDARYTKDETDGLLAGKADKQQEAWIKPTLLAPYLGAPRYMKDSFGFVHMEGRVSDGDGSQSHLFTLPVGYRPVGMADFRVHSSNFTTGGGYIRITSSGEVRNSLNHTFINLDGITFRAEV